MSQTRSRLRVRSGPSGVHVFDRISGLNILFDEVRVPYEQWSTAPRQVSIALTNACDLNCSFCFAPKETATLDYENLTSWINELDAQGCLSVGFGGGEPTLFRHLVDLCHFTAKNTGLAVTLTTHGHRLDDSLLANLAGSVHFLRVSMDGVGQTYEAIRGRSFAYLYNRLKTLTDLAPFGINFVVNAQTFPDLDTALELAAEVGAAEFLLLPEQSAGGVGGIDARTTRLFQHWVNQYQGIVPLVVSEAGSEGLPICNPLPEEIGLFSFAYIDALGTLKRTSFDSNGIPIGEDGVLRAINLLQKTSKEE